MKVIRGMGCRPAVARGRRGAKVPKSWFRAIWGWWCGVPSVCAPPTLLCAPLCAGSHHWASATWGATLPISKLLNFSGGWSAGLCQRGAPKRLMAVATGGKIPGTPKPPLAGRSPPMVPNPFETYPTFRHSSLGSMAGERGF